MSPNFDPYHRWLGISPKDQPPTHYRLLGIDLFESDPEVILDAAERQMRHVRTYQIGPHSALSQGILNELGAARACLLDSAAKNAYDSELRRTSGDQDSGVPVAKLPPTITPPPSVPPPPISGQDCTSFETRSERTEIASIVFQGPTAGSVEERLMRNHHKRLVVAGWGLGAAAVFIVLLAIATLYGVGTKSEVTGDSTGQDLASNKDEAKAKTPRVSNKSVARDVIGVAVDFADCKAKAHQFSIQSDFDIQKTWRLAFEVNIPRFDPGWHQILYWGDDRAGRDPLYVRLTGNNLETGVGDARDNRLLTIRASLGVDDLDKWVSVILQYDSKRRTIELHIQGKLHSTLTCKFAPALDRPMPIWIGGANGDWQRFFGRVRSLCLTNTE